MNRTRLWTIGSVLLMVIILAGGYVLGVQPQLAAAAISDADRLNQETQNQTLAADLKALKEQFDSIDEVKADLADIRQDIPQASEQDELTDQIIAFAAQSGLVLTDYVYGEASAFVPSVDGAVAQEEAAADTATPADPAASQFVTLPVDLTLEGGFPGILNFLNELQNGKRLFLAYGIDISIDEEDPSKFVLKVTGYAYVFTGADGAAEAAAGETPTDAGDGADLGAETTE